MSKHIYVVACLYDENKINSSLDFLKLLKKLFINGPYELIVTLVVNNIELVSNLNLKCDEIVLIGSNENAEFGAWQEGIAHIKKQYPSMNNDSKFIFFNDTIFHHFIPTLLGLLIFLNDVNATENDGVVSGDVQLLPANASVIGVELDKYICTAIFYINYKAMNDIGFKFLRIKASDILYKPNSHDLLVQYFDEDVLSYRIGSWLFGGGWYRSKKFRQFDPNLLKLKLAMIINEKAISAELLKSNCNFKQSLKAGFKWIYFIKALKVFCRLYGLNGLLHTVLIKRKYNHRSFNK